MEYVTSANIACGGHAGDEATMERTARLALDRGVRIGAHPGYPDRANFGRLEMPMTAAEIERTVREQIERLDAVVRSLGGRDRPREAPRRALQRGRAQYGSGARHRRRRGRLGPARHALRPGRLPHAGRLARKWACQVAAEAFADRRYEPDGTLRSRKFADALITDPREAAAQALRFAREGKAQTICVHGDTPGAVDILKACREALLYQ